MTSTSSTDFITVLDSSEEGDDIKGGIKTEDDADVVDGDKAKGSSDRKEKMSWNEKTVSAIAVAYVADSRSTKDLIDMLAELKQNFDVNP